MTANFIGMRVRVEVPGETTPQRYRDAAKRINLTAYHPSRVREVTEE